MRAVMTRNALTVIGVVVALLVVAADRFSKWWILDVTRLPEGQDPLPVLSILKFTMVWNEGITFGLFGKLLNTHGQWSYLLIVAVALAVVTALIMWLRRAESRLVAIALGAIVGGALSNIIDRLSYGRVADFILVDIPISVGDIRLWPYVFNLADAAIVCGVAALVIDSMLPRPVRDRQRT